MGWGSFPSARCLHDRQTTLVAEFVRVGATYYSDEYALLDRRGNVYPYPQPLGIRQPGGREQVDTSIETLGGTAGQHALPVAWVVAASYQPSGEHGIGLLSSAETAAILLQNCVGARRFPRQTLAAISEVARNARGITQIRGEALEAVQMLLEAIKEPV